MYDLEHADSYSQTSAAISWKGEVGRVKIQIDITSQEQDISRSED